MFETGKARQVRLCSEQSSMRRRNEATKALLDTLCTPYQAAPGTPPTLGNTKIAGTPASNSVAGILKRSEALIGDYHRLKQTDHRCAGCRARGCRRGLGRLCREDSEAAEDLECGGYQEREEGAGGRRGRR